MPDKLLEVKHLKKYFKTKKGPLRAVDDVSFSIGKGETLGLVGESGCGKSTCGRAIIRLNDPNSGEVLFEGKNILDFHRRADLRRMKQEMQIVFQDPYSSLNPRLNTQDLIADPLVINKIGSNKEEIRQKVLEAMDMVGLEKRLLDAYPHELDGGRRQRIGIARALVLNPKFIVMDEPVSALDVSIQAQILNLLSELQDDLGLTYLFIAHNLSVVKHISDRIAVMYLGKIVEVANYLDIFIEPLHPYSQALLSAIPIPKRHIKRERIILEGDVPSPVNPPDGCRFCGRCRMAMPICSETSPELKDMGNGHKVACHLYDDKPVPAEAKAGKDSVDAELD